ncbi:zinc ribbon domain-containing protein [Companilactobacillus huachuanensis]|uniref:Zinc ribbon domain-containing protein n=1 Tax=Companilactobacillus huachuanensis TaxID=2559914 RepID=A0ABW1RM03_9LACO|nr:zinc ribbon domain-containing protein [Companilactobacillus huachuanensis]
MFCPNCGHKVEPNQKFCDNCGWALKKKNTEDTTNEKDDDSVRSLSEIENELNQEEPAEKPHLQQAPAQEREYGSANQPKQAPVAERKPEPVRPDPEPAMKTFESSNRSSFSKSSASEPVDDKTQVYSKNDFNPISQKPYKSVEHEDNFKKTFDDPIKDPIGNPFGPTETEKRAADAKRQAEAVDPNDGFVHNMMKFAKNNAYVSIFAIIIAAILLVFKRNYGYIALAIVIILWFLLSQLRHGNELGANKALKRETSLKKDSNSNSNPKTETYNERPAKQKKDRRDKFENPADRLKPNHKTTTQKIIIFSSIIGFIASVAGPFLDGLSLSGTIANAANYTANNLGAQPTWITNGFSAIRLICFLSPVIALIAGCFRSRGSIRLVRIFTFLPTILYAALYAALNAGLVNSSAITGQVVVNASRSFGMSFYVLLITSVVSLIMAYTLRPRVK